MTQDVSPASGAGQLTRRALPAVVVVAGAAAGYVVGTNHAESTAGPGANAREVDQPTAGGGAADGGPQPLATLDEVPAGGGLVLEDAGIVLTRSESDSVAAFSAICTHQGCTVNEVSGGTINCFCHGSRFDAATGAPVAGPAKAPLEQFAVTVRDNAVFPA